jgi:hypothetical protein
VESGAGGEQGDLFLFTDGLDDGSLPTMEVWDGLFLRRRHGQAA